MRNPFAHPAGGSFLPHDYVKGKNDFRANLICLGLFGVVMAGVVGAFFATNRQLLMVERQQEQITAEYMREKPKVERIEELKERNRQMLEKAELTTALIENVPRSVLLSEIVNRMPGGMTLLSVELAGKRLKGGEGAPVAGGSNAARARGTLAGRPASDTAGKAAAVKARPTAGKGKSKDAAPKPEAPRFEYTLRLVGVATRNPEITDYLKSLQESPVLDGVDLKYIEGTDIDKEVYRKFEIHASIRKNADGRAMVASSEKKPEPAAPAAAPSTPGEKPAASPTASAPADPAEGGGNP